MNIIEAARMIKLGEVDVVLAGVTEAQISPEGVALFDGTTALDTGDDPREVSRPFHAEANGFVMGEGAGVLVMESLAHARKRGATVLAELIGYGETADAYDATLSNGIGAEAAMRRALSAVTSGDYGRPYIHAHATGTSGDAIEIQAISRLFEAQDVLGVSSTKGATGHLLGAASAFESIVSIMALRTGIIPPTLKLDKPVPETEGWNMSPHEATDVGEIDLVIKNAFGFGGLNAVTAYAHAE
jgi:3-oxoacyl-[acyl-carrier-protein] synthase II